MPHRFSHPAFKFVSYASLAYLVAYRKADFERSRTNIKERKRRRSLVLSFAINVSERSVFSQSENAF